MRHHHTALLLVALLVSPKLAWAQATDEATAEALFDEGRRLMRAGDYDRACKKLEASQRLDHGVGTLLNLGECYERGGQIASAWARFREASSAARAAGEVESERVARERVAALEPCLSYLILVVSAHRSTTLPALASGFALPAGTSCYWTVETHGPHASVDAATGPAGLLDAYANGGPRGTQPGDGSFTLTAKRSFTTAP